MHPPTHLVCLVRRGPTNCCVLGTHRPCRKIRDGRAENHILLSHRRSDLSMTSTSRALQRRASLATVSTLCTFSLQMRPTTISAGSFGAGPFSHRMMLTMQEKGVPYNMMLLDEQQLPDW